MKVMAIIGIVWFSLSLLCMSSFQNGMNDEALGWGYLGMFFALPLAIVVLVQTNKKGLSEKNLTNELIKLKELKDNGILNDNEFESMKLNLLKK
jgi:hypothetical protein